MVLVPSPANPTGRAIHLCYEHCREPTEPAPVSDVRSRDNDVQNHLITNMSGEPMKSDFGCGFDFGFNPFFDDETPPAENLQKKPKKSKNSKKSSKAKWSQSEREMYKALKRSFKKIIKKEFKKLNKSK